jgi:hypothetical protein
MNWYRCQDNRVRTDDTTTLPNKPYLKTKRRRRRRGHGCLGREFLWPLGRSPFAARGLAVVLAGAVPAGGDGRLSALVRSLAVGSADDPHRLDAR